jgi:hypothetical protein
MSWTGTLHHPSGSGQPTGWRAGSGRIAVRGSGVALRLGPGPQSLSRSISRSGFSWTTLTGQVRRRPSAVSPASAPRCERVGSVWSAPWSGRGDRGADGVPSPRPNWLSSRFALYGVCRWAAIARFGPVKRSFKKTTGPI